jgi:PAS domain S-box-containing protein
MTDPSRAHVLLVEDNEATRYSVTRTLRTAGFTVSAAATAEQGLQLAREGQPDLALLDVRLPGLSGLELCRVLKRDPATEGLPVVFLSASHVAPEDQIAGLDVGADAYFTHPVEPHVLVAQLRALLRARFAEARYRRLAESNLVGVAEFDLDGRVLSANDEFLRMLGRERGELPSLRWPELTPPEWKDLDARKGQELLRTGVARAWEKEFFHKDGARVPVLLAGAALDGGRTRAVGVYVDLTQRRRIEREREDALARAEAAQRRTTFLLRATSALMGTPLQVETALARLAELCAHELCDWCAVDRLRPSGAWVRVAVTAADPALQGPARELAGAPAPPLSPGEVEAGGSAAARALRSGRTEALLAGPGPDALEGAGGQAHRAALEALGLASALVVPFAIHGRALGRLTLVRRSAGAGFAPVELALAEEIGGRAALALDNARLYEASRAAR